MKRTERNFWLDVNLFVTCLATVYTGLLLWLFIPHQAAAVFLGFDRHFWLTAHIFSGLASTVGENCYSEFDLWTHFGLSPKKALIQ